MKKLVVLIFVIFTLYSCTNKSLQYNNKLVQIQRSLDGKASAFATKRSAAKQENLYQLIPDAQDLITGAQKRIEEVNAMEMPAGAANFKNAVLAQFDFIKKIYQQFIILADTTSSEEQKLKADEAMRATAGDAQHLEDNAIKAQQVFAKENGFKIE